MAKSEQKKQAALEALLETGSLTEAAEMAGISRRSLYNYLYHDVDFARAYDEARSRKAVAFMDALTERRDRAQAVIMELMEDEKQPAAIRLRAAQAIMTAAAEQEKTVSAITKTNIDANKPLLDFSFR